jgi:hypothetical protein
MIPPDTSCIFAQVFTDRLAWRMRNPEGDLVGHGVVRTYEELRGVQIRAGVIEVILHRYGKGFHLPQNLRYGNEWRVAAPEDLEELEALFLFAA